MARRVIQEVVDDIDGKPADETVSFGIDGVDYEIDLTAAHASELREAFGPFVAAGKKLGRRGAAAAPGRAGRTAAPQGPTRGDRDRNRAIREWAQRNGIEISERGRLAQDVIDRYDAAGGR
ncbi:Lsr2 family protein [Dactylosporangium fulvum]|uniref:Lsr2 family protein n=1 Tax=Dactylosporangium fulvum TaxID=53359 RepID=A0ABY5VPV5_9ACTN|nr:Lsr2 family protein [Dactylosporangium fulvum]UWP79129.1 Lsr2 family protein [Dactylosporangium fulvum]